MTRSPLITCLLGYDSNTCDLPHKGCSNYRFCQNLSAAWPLPFYWDSEFSALIVTFSRASVRQRWNPRVVDDIIDGFSSDLYEADYERGQFRKLMESLWQQAGWMPAVANPNFPHELNPDYDPIPF